LYIGGGNVFEGSDHFEDDLEFVIW